MLQHDKSENVFAFRKDLFYFIVCPWVGRGGYSRECVDTYVFACVEPKRGYQSPQSCSDRCLWDV